MSENNRSYRLRTKIGVTEDSPVVDKYLTVKLDEDIDTIDIMSLKIKQENTYKFHAADYGVVVGRAIANGGFGVPNVKVSVFIAASEATKNDAIYNAIYPYERVTQKNSDNIRYNLLQDAVDDDCYQVVGTFPNKRLVLDDSNYLEIYDEYYKFTTRTNKAGDYMIFGIPTGGQTLHFDIDLSDVGVLSQKPRDMVYKGYDIKQFENANQFKKDDNLANLPQIISQDDSVYIYPFWGDEDENIIGITRHDIDVNYKFEPTCVFMGSVVTDTNSNHISKKCIPTVGMGMMEDLVTGSGSIEMIRKKQNGDVEQFNIQGTQLIDDNGVWCYQIPMNLDYMITDEYGNLVPSDDPTKGIATRTSVRFRFSMQDFENDTLNSFRTKVLVPNNPQNEMGNPDYVFGSFTEDESFRDLFWNNVYTVKSFIPRFQKGNGNRNRRFSGIKQCNYHGQNNPIPYNNMRINLSFQFVITCLLVRLFIWMVGIYNAFITALANIFAKIANYKLIKLSTKYVNKIDNWYNTGSGLVRTIKKAFSPIIEPLIAPLRIFQMIGNFCIKLVQSMSCVYVDGSMCEQLEGTWFFAPNCGKKSNAAKDPNFYVWKNMMARVEGKKMNELDFSGAGTKNGGGMVDKQSIDSSNADDLGDADSMVTINDKQYSYVISRGVNYFLECIEISLAQEFRVVQFDFYNDWINGMIYIPRWERSLKKKRKYFLFGKSRVEVRACNDSYQKRFFERKNNLTEQCGVSYKAKTNDNSVNSKVGCKSNKKYKCHKKHGRRQFRIFNDGGVVHSELTASGLYAYYFRPCEYITNRNASKNKRVNLFATDIVLLGSLSDCDIHGTPMFTNELTSTTYQLPSPLAHTDATEEGFTYVAGSAQTQYLLDDNRLTGVFDMDDTLLNPKDDGSVTEESGLDWSYTGPGQGEPKKQKTYTPGGHFLGISCVNAESSIKSCVNLKRICEVNVWSSQRQEVFNGYAADKSPTYVDVIPNGLIARDDIADGIFRKQFSTMNHNGLKTRIDENGFVVYDFTYMTPENFGGELSKYSKGSYNEPNPISNMEGYLAKNSTDLDEDGNEWGSSTPESASTAGGYLTPIRRSLDERDSDYMKFRLGIDNETNSTIQAKYLGSDDYGYYMPVYNNSFYFYFGLIPGSTALEQFHKLFFAECERSITTTDLRLRISLNYTEYGIENAFSEPVVISIFETGVTFNPSTDSLKIFSTATPIKAVVDNDPAKTAVISNEAGDAAYVEFNLNYFSFGIGKHTVYVMDSNGRSVTKLVEVVQERPNICPVVTPEAFTRDDYIINNTADLVSGSATGRDSLGGMFRFAWAAGSCCGENYLFSYRNPSDPADAPPICVPISSCTMLFVSKGHIIKVGNWPDSEITSYEEFVDYGGRIFQGHVNGSGNGSSVYAGESASYDLYVLYDAGGGNRTQMPILLQDHIFIGEPDAIDFDFFNEVLESEDDSPVTFRNPLIKTWHDHTSDWYLHLYEGELTPKQIWYIRKNMFYVMQGVNDDDGGDFELNEYFSSNRTLYINQYFPSTIGNVICNLKVPGATGYTPSSSFEVKNYGAQQPQEYLLYITGQNAETPSVTYRTPPMAYNNGIFNFYVFYKPYYYQAVIWEGYSVMDITNATNNPAACGHINGKIYNGIVYDSGSTQVFGPTLFNDMEVGVDITVTPMTNDFTCGRTSTMEYSDTAKTFTDSSNLLLITEGAPDDYESVYTPVEYSVEANSVGTSGNWGVKLLIDNFSTNTVKLVLTTEGSYYDELNIYWSNDKTLIQANQNLAIKTIDGNDFVSQGYAKTSLYDVGNEGNDEITAEITVGNNSITNGTILAESVKHDRYVFCDTVSNIGFLASRNFIRNAISINYTRNTSRNKIIFYLKSTEDSVKGVYRIYVELSFEDNGNNDFRNEFARRIEGVYITVPSGSNTTEYELIGDFGYSFDVSGRYLVAEIAELDESDNLEAVYEDEFIRAAKANNYTFSNYMVRLVSSGFGTIGVDGNGIEYNNAIDDIEIDYKGNVSSTESEPSTT